MKYFRPTSVLLRNRIGPNRYNIYGNKTNSLFKRPGETGNNILSSNVVFSKEFMTSELFEPTDFALNIVTPLSIPKQAAKTFNEREETQRDLNLVPLDEWDHFNLDLEKTKEETGRKRVETERPTSRRIADWERQLTEWTRNQTDQGSRNPTGWDKTHGGMAVMSKFHLSKGVSIKTTSYYFKLRKSLSQKQLTTPKTMRNEPSAFDVQRKHKGDFSSKKHPKTQRGISNQLEVPFSDFAFY